MRAAITPSYGPAGVFETREVPTPTIEADEVLVQVHASPVTAGDRRLRAADFPPLTVVPGRLMLGVFRPKNAVQGTMFAGRIVAVGGDVTRFAVGDDVFGSTMHGAYAEYLAVKADGPIARMPATMRYDQAASVPYGGVTALRFVRDLAAVQPGEEVLIVGAAGGVGLFAVQIAKHLGAVVTAVCSRRSFDVVRSLGADHVIDYQAEDFTKAGRRYHVILDFADVTTFSQSRGSLTDDGRYLTPYITAGLLLQMLVTSIAGGPRVKFTIAMGDRDDMEELREMLEKGVIRPVVAQHFPLERIAEAHAEAERRGGTGSVVVTPEPRVSSPAT